MRLHHIIEYLVFLVCAVAISWGSAASLKGDLAASLRREGELIDATQQLLRAQEAATAHVTDLQQQQAQWQDTINRTVMLDIMAMPGYQYRAAMDKRLKVLEARSLAASTTADAR